MVKTTTMVPQYPSAHSDGPVVLLFGLLQEIAHRDRIIGNTPGVSRGHRTPEDAGHDGSRGCPCPPPCAAVQQTENACKAVLVTLLLIRLSMPCDSLPFAPRGAAPGPACGAVGGAAEETGGAEFGEGALRAA